MRLQPVMDKSLSLGSLIQNLWREHALLAIGIAVTFASAILYAPALSAYFISDDFGTVAFLFFNRQTSNWIPWFLLQSNDGGIYFRPLGQLFYLTDFWWWGVQPFGYHLTNVIFHGLNCLIVYLLAARLSRRALGFIAALFFAVMAVHSEAVAWIGARYDVICAFFFFASVLAFVLFRQRGERSFYFAALALFFLALASKEIAVTLPFVLLAFDFIFNGGAHVQSRAWLKWHLPFWLGLGLGLGARWVAFGRVGYGNLIEWNVFVFWVDKTIARLANPLVVDDLGSLRCFFLLAFTGVIWIFRSRREIVFGALWIPLVYIATFNSGASERSFYIPSFGLALALAGIFGVLFSRDQMPVRAASLAGLTGLIAVYSSALYTRNQQFQLAGEVAKAIPEQVKALHPTLPQGTRLIFTGVPDELVSGVLVYITGLTPSFQLTFRDPTLETLKVEKFPILGAELEKTFFFEVDHRRVRERADLARMLQERSRCGGSTRVLAEWNFSRDAQGWEPWNDLAAFEVRDGALTMRAEGNDPYLGSPPLNVPALEVGEIAIVMRTRSNRPGGMGSVYWLASGQNDFSPELQESFAVQMDGDWHTYRVDLGSSGKLFVGDALSQLRLDPIDAPAEIALKSIAIFARCDRG